PTFLKLADYYWGKAQQDVTRTTENPGFGSLNVNLDDVDTGGGAQISGPRPFVDGHRPHRYVSLPCLRRVQRRLPHIVVIGDIERQLASAIGHGEGVGRHVLEGVDLDVRR